MCNDGLCLRSAESPEAISAFCSLWPSASTSITSTLDFQLVWELFLRCSGLSNEPRPSQVTNDGTWQCTRCDQCILLGARVSLS